VFCKVLASRHLASRPIRHDLKALLDRATPRTYRMRSGSYVANALDRGAFVVLVTGVQANVRSSSSPLCSVGSAVTMRHHCHVLTALKAHRRSFDAGRGR